jgi:hypothetical protein
MDVTEKKFSPLSRLAGNEPLTTQIVSCKYSTDSTERLSDIASFMTLCRANAKYLANILLQRPINWQLEVTQIPFHKQDPLGGRHDRAAAA